MEDNHRITAQTAVNGVPTVFSCKLCGRNFSNATSLEIHEQYSHGGGGAGTATVSPGPPGPPAAPPDHDHPFLTATRENNQVDWENTRRTEEVVMGTPTPGKNGDDQQQPYYPSYWPAVAPDPSHEPQPPASAPEMAHWTENHFPPTPDSSGFSSGSGHHSKSPSNDIGAEILDLDSNRVHFYTPAPAPPPPPPPPPLVWHEMYPGYFGQTPGPPVAAPPLPSQVYQQGGPAQVDSTPPPPMVQPRPYQESEPIQQHQQSQLQQPAQYYTPGIGLQSAAIPPPPGQFPGYGTGQSSEPSSPSEKLLGAGHNQYCKRPKTYLCEVCDKKFTSMGHLKRHFNTIVHKQTKEGKRSGGAVVKSKPRSFSGDQPAQPPPLVSMPSKMYGIPTFPVPAGAPPPAHFPMTPPMQEGTHTPPTFDFSQHHQSRPPSLPPAPASQQARSSPTPMVAPPPQPLSYHQRLDSEYLMVSVSSAPNPQPSRYGPAAYTSANNTRGNSVYSGYPGPEPGPQPIYTVPNSYATQPSQQLQQPHDRQQQVPFQQVKREEQEVEETPTGSPASGSGSQPGSEDSCELTEEPFICCNKRFSSIQYYRQHRESQHQGERLTKCTHCGRRHRPEQVSCEEYARKYRKTHQCDTCEKDFTHFSDLKRHRYTHLAQKPFVCNQCGKGFIRKDQMEKHLPTHDHNGSHPNGRASLSAQQYSAATAFGDHGSTSVNNGNVINQQPPANNGGILGCEEQLQSTINNSDQVDQQPAFISLSSGNNVNGDGTVSAKT